MPNPQMTAANVSFSKGSDSASATTTSAHGALREPASTLAGKLNDADHGGSRVSSVGPRRRPRRERANAQLRPHGVHTRGHLGAHAARLRPIAGVALLAPLAGSVDANLAAPQCLVGSVVKLVDRPVDERQVTLRIEVGEKPPRHLRDVLHVDVLVENADHL